MEGNILEHTSKKTIRIYSYSSQAFLHLCKTSLRLRLRSCVTRILSNLYFSSFIQIGLAITAWLNHNIKHKFQIYWGDTTLTKMASKRDAHPISQTISRDSKPLLWATTPSVEINLIITGLSPRFDLLIQSALRNTNLIQSLINFQKLI